MRGLAKRAYVVTGAGSGIGRATALRLAAEGASVLAVERDAAKADETASLKESEAGRIVPFVQDVSAADAPERCLAAAAEAFGAVDGLVNNAGLGNPKSVATTTDAELDQYLDMNFRTAFRFSRAYVNQRGKSGGVVVNMSSVFGLVGVLNAATYSAAKAAIVGLTRQMATEFGPSGFRINAVAPGLIMTPAHTAERQVQNKWFYDTFLDGTPLMRSGSADEVASVIAFLCSDDASFVTGQVIAIDGGWAGSKVQYSAQP